MDKNNTWLQHLEYSVPVTGLGSSLSMYTVALEGWRRGLTLKIHRRFIKNKLKIGFSLAGNSREYTFKMADHVSNETIRICKYKDLTKRYLSNVGIPFPTGKKFSEEAMDEEIINYAKQIGFPIVLKPTNGKKGTGVFTNIRDVEKLRETLLHVRYELNYADVIVEKFILGEEYRIYVVGDKVIGISKKRPANIIGDGINNIKKLIELKNQERRKSPYLHSRPIKIGDEVLDLIKESGYTLESVPKDGEVVYLRTKSNITSGGDPVDYTNVLSTEIKNTAIKARKAIPGLSQCGIDMIVDQDNSGIIIEINTGAGLGAHLFPMEGQARDIPKAIVDYYFPETINKGSHQEDLFYFDFIKIKETIESGYTQSVTVSPTPQQNLSIRKSFIVSGKVHGVNYRQWVQKKAIRLDLHGSAKNLKNGDVRIVVAGDENSIISFREVIHHQKPRKAMVENVVEQDWRQSVKVGFELLDERSSKKQIKLEIELNNKNKQLMDTNKKLKDTEISLHEALEKNKSLQHHKNLADWRYKKILQSRIWRYTSPIRKTLNYFKKIRLSKT